MTGTAAGARKRIRRGRTPSSDHVVIGTRDDWTLYEMLQDEPSEVWINCKLIHKSRAGKANYWFGWNVPGSRFGRVRDANILLENDPDTYAWVLSVLDPDTYANLV